MAAPPAKNTPKDVQVMQAVLKDIGVSDYEPRVVNQMLEFAYRYVTDVLDDAKVYAGHSGKKTIDGDDVRLAVQCKMDHSFTSPPPRDLLMEVARHKNSQSLPLIKKYTGPRLPPDRYCLSSTNYRMKSKKPRLHITPGGLTSLGGGSRTPQGLVQTLTPGSRIQGKPRLTTNLSTGQLSLVTMGVTRPTVTVVSKPSTPIATTVTIPKPSFQISAGPSSILSNMKRKREENDDYDKP
ncbi:transcription initiation factor TFIID subunit 9-like [Lineus longissimus]|uniref:transcription initiation factor TFIID subunit 9-like n=1 Tax=Lineus longissimus TaxID=88925 RepID=UPI002B4E28C3